MIEYGGFVEIDEVRELPMRAAPPVPEEVVRQKEMLAKLRRPYKRRRRTRRKAAWRLREWELRRIIEQWQQEEEGVRGTVFGI